MRFLSLVGAAGLCAPASAFPDTSPLIVLSTAELIQHRVGPSEQLITAGRARFMLDGLLSGCPTERYLLVSQPQVNAFDLATPEGACAVPNVCRAINRESIRTKVAVSEVFGDLSIHELSGGIKQACAKAERTADVSEITLPALPAESRARALADNDYILRDTLEGLETDKSHTIIYFVGVAEPTYEAEFPELAQMDIKRQVAQASKLLRRDAPTNSTHQSFFDKYQFFTPGIFVGLLVAFFLMAILAVGVKALGSLEVPYGAFEKEMGPAAQKKQH